MVRDTSDVLESLHTNAVDARNGYQEALKDADGHGMTPLFREMIALHERNSGELRAELAKLNRPVDDSGSLMTTVHRTIMNVRSLFDGLDESVLPGLIDGEERNVSSYSDALKSPLPRDISSLLANQRARISQMIGRMRVDEVKADMPHGVA